VVADGPQECDVRHAVPRDPLDDYTAAMAERRRGFVRERTGAFGRGDPRRLGRQPRPLRPQPALSMGASTAARRA
jgi:hypothetical protein